MKTETSPGINKGTGMSSGRLFENLPGMVYLCKNDPDWTMLMISQNCSDVTGYSSEDLIGNRRISYAQLILQDDRDMVYAEIQKALQDKTSYIIEYRIKTAAGKIKWVWEQGIGVYSRRGELKYLEGYITELSEAQIMEKEEKYRLLVENIQDGIVISQFDKFIFINERFARMLGYTVKELLMRDYRDVYTEKGLQILSERHGRRQRGEVVPSKYETVFKRKDGSEIDVEANVTIIDYKGNPATFAVIRDIRERKRAEQEIRKQRQYFEAVFDSSPAAIVSLDMDERIVRANAQFEKLFGYTLDEIRGHNIDDLIAPKELQQEARQITRKIRQGGMAGTESKRLRKDGTPVDVSISGAPIKVDGKQIGIIAIYVDISEIKKAHEEINRQKQYFEALVNSASDAIVSLDLNNKVVSVNRCFEKMFGYSLEEIKGKNIDHYIIPDEDIDSAINITASVRKGSETHFERKRKRKDGSPIDVEISGAPIVVNGEHIGALAIYRDITERKRFENALTVERNLMRTLIDNLPDSIYVKDTESRKTLSNRANYSDMGAKSESEVLGKTDFDFYPPDLAASFVADDKKVIQTGQPVINREEETTRSDGSIGWQLTSKIPLRDSNGNITGLVGIGHDITERKKAEEEREKIISELREALAKVNTLSGLIPICANCKKIRDDKGYWSDVELYISKHSTAEFSHGLCNDCMKKLYPEQYKRMVKQGKIKDH